MKTIIKPLCILLGCLSLGLGALGVVLPVLPTTPFLLLTAFCFARGSTRFHNWFLGTGLYRRHLATFVKDRAMPMRTKLAICLPVSAMLLLAIWLAPIWHARVLIAAVLLFKWYYFLFRIRTIPAAKN
ncbi:MAG: YbaN family protein [Oscillospiraceae bacterium]|nr:YbaN family protein [Oscillospiraceae bacterium]